MCNDMALNKESHTVSNSHSIINSFKFIVVFPSSYTLIHVLFLLILLSILDAVSPEGSLMAMPTINSMVNSTELLICTAVGGPGNIFQWRMMDMILVDTDQVNVTVISAQSGGDYDCIVSNAAGSDNITTLVNGIYYYALVPSCCCCCCFSFDEGRSGGIGHWKVLNHICCYNMH